MTDDFGEQLCCEWCKNPTELFRFCSGACRQHEYRQRKGIRTWGRGPLPKAAVAPPWQPHDIPVAVIAHPKRWKQAQKLVTQIGAETLCWDNLHQGCEANHRKSWQWLSEGHQSGYSVILEDDIEVPSCFRNQLQQMLAVAPPPVVSLYLGRGRPPHWQLPIMEAITSLNEDVCWFTGPALLSAQGYAIRTDLLTDLLEFTARLNTNTMPIDEQVSAWMHKRDYRVAYCWPSLVQHLDGSPLIQQRADQQPRIEPRVAWRCGTRTSWGTSSAEIKTPEELGIEVISA